MNFVKTALPGVMIIETEVHGDSRGLFAEIFRENEFKAAGVDLPFVMDARSRTAKHTLRGLHFQEPQPQGKLVTVTRGAIFDVAADINPASPTFQQWTSSELTDENGRSLWIPPGYAHGFLSLAEETDIHYRMTDYWAPDAEHVIRWDDPDLAIDWPVADPEVSDRDAAAPRLADYLNAL